MKIFLALLWAAFLYFAVHAVQVLNSAPPGMDLMNPKMTPQQAAAAMPYTTNFTKDVIAAAGLLFLLWVIHRVRRTGKARRMRRARKSSR